MPQQGGFSRHGDYIVFTRSKRGGKEGTKSLPKGLFFLSPEYTNPSLYPYSRTPSILELFHSLHRFCLFPPIPRFFIVSPFALSIPVRFAGIWLCVVVIFYFMLFWSRTPQLTNPTNWVPLSFDPRLLPPVKDTYHTTRDKLAIRRQNKK
jgi:hypothetical protein